MSNKFSWSKTLNAYFSNNRKQTKGRTQQRVPIMIDMPFAGGTIRVPTGQTRLIRHQTNHNRTFKSDKQLVQPNREELTKKK